jgi:hypothetical protein
MADIGSWAAIAVAIFGVLLILASGRSRRAGPTEWAQVQATAGTGFILLAIFIRGFA